MEHTVFSPRLTSRPTAHTQNLMQPLRKTRAPLPTAAVLSSHAPRHQPGGAPGTFNACVTKIYRTSSRRSRLWWRWTNALGYTIVTIAIAMQHLTLTLSHLHRWPATIIGSASPCPPCSVRQLHLCTRIFSSSSVPRSFGIVVARSPIPAPSYWRNTPVTGETFARHASYSAGIHCRRGIFHCLAMPGNPHAAWAVVASLPPLVELQVCDDPGTVFFRRQFVEQLLREKPQRPIAKTPSPSHNPQLLHSACGGVRSQRRKAFLPIAPRCTTACHKTRVFGSIWASSVRVGNTISLDGAPFRVQSLQKSKQAREAALIKLKLKNLKTGKLLDRNLRNGDKVEEAYIETRRLVFLGETTAGQVTMGRSDAPSSSTASTSYDSRHDHYHEPLRQDNDIDQPLLFQVPSNGKCK
eukprot:GHVT01017274.1.p1 GENE.GHVT01017274.1~~GHVT01017274.1.p1  ORF type:complete len:410 (+),score=23.43 GHVT01017274.1:603-1832(+)